MSDFDAMPGTSSPWREPRLYTGTAESRPILRYDGGQTGSVTVRVGSVAAEFRRPAGSCRVAACVRADPDERICLMAVATGAGSEAGGQAAEQAADSATRFRLSGSNGLRLTGRDLLRAAGDCAHHVNKDLGRAQEDLRRTGRPVAEFRTGLLLAVFPVDVPPGGSVPFVALRVGHGVAWTVRPGSLDEIGFSAAAAGQAHHLGRMLPLTTTRSSVETTEGHLRDGEVLALTTEGLIRDEQDPVRAFLAPAWAAPPRPLEFLRQLAVRRGDRDADRAAAVAWIGHHELTEPATGQ